MPADATDKIGAVMQRVPKDLADKLNVIRAHRDPRPSFADLIREFAGAKIEREYRKVVEEANRDANGGSD